MKKNILLLALFAVITTIAWAQGPNNSGQYYKAANGKTGLALKSAMGEIIFPHTELGYNGLWKAYEKTDRRYDGTNAYVRDWYSNATKYGFNDHTGSYQGEGDMFNREHTVCQSWFEDYGLASTLKCDVVHVVPTDGYVNGKRSNNPFGEVIDDPDSTKNWYSKNGYSKLGSCQTPGFSGKVFEPNDEIKGDIARIYFYMVTCYASYARTWEGGMFADNDTGLEPWAYNMLLRWAKQDPVSEEETARNNAVYEKQNNRNPFVDYPGLEDYVWGDKNNIPFSYDNFEGSGPYIAMPMFSPNAGTYYNSVEVTLTCATEGATIYYTTGGADASEQSIEYTEPFTLTETTTIKAVAVLDGEVSSQAEATYTITDQLPPGPDIPVDGEIALDNELFGTSYSGSINRSDNNDLTGTQNGITVIYSLGTGQNRYCNDEQIRLYPGNTLTISVEQGTMAAIEFVFASGTPSKDLNIDNTPIYDGKWSGCAQSVTTTFTKEKHARLTAIKISMTPEAPELAAPIISPDGGTYQESVEVTLECDDEEADIYYTLDGSDVTEEDGILYEEPFTLTETATVKAIAVTEDLVSPISEATFTITDEPIDPFIPAEGEIALTNQFFGTDYHGTTYDKADFVGTLNNVVVTYAKGEGRSRYVTDNQIRLYTGNTLNISSTQGIITEIRFIMADDTPSRDLVSDDGTPIVDDVWTGSSKSGITKSVTVAMGTGTHIRLVGLKVITSVNTGVDMAQRNRLDGRRVIYNLRGQRVTTPRRGLYIVDGKKLFIE